MIYKRPAYDFVPRFWESSDTLVPALYRARKGRIRRERRDGVQVGVAVTTLRRVRGMEQA